MAETPPLPRPPTRFAESVRRNLLALIGLAVALTALGYNTWRNETTESHRNVRQAAFMVLGALGELQQLADTRFFGGERDEENRIAIWGRVVLVRDIAPLVSTEAAQRAEALHATWTMQAEPFDRGEPAAERAVATAVRDTRQQVLAELDRLR